MISPSTARLDRSKKLTIYAREAVRHSWLVVSLARTIEVLRLEAGRWVIIDTHAGDVVVSIEPFEEIELELAVLWGNAEDESEAAPSGT